MKTFNLFETPNIKHVHFIGIGGISMSGLAEVLLSLGYRVSGSDIKASDATAKLERLGAKIYISHSEENIESPDLVVYTAAIKETNPEIIKSRKLNIPVIDRAALLGQIMKKYPYSVAISGTHGKTTTTSMIATIMLESGLDPTIHIGGELSLIGGATKVGGDRYFVAEACEYYESFLKFYPYIGIILNIEYDHADYYKNIDHVRETFLKFARQVATNGYLVACIDDPNVASILDGLQCNKITYGLKTVNAMWSARNIEFDGLGCASYTLLHNSREAGTIKLNVPGIHNVSNSLAAIAACHVLGCGLQDISRSMGSFHGAGRRFELKGVSDNIKVIDDYAHHPSEIMATLKATRNASNSRIWCIFQPHTYSRTKSLLNEFAAAFSDADIVVLADIYSAAREVDNGEINSGILADKINENGQYALYIPGFETIVEYLEQNVSPGDMIITMGAGDIYKVGEMFLKNKQVPAAI